MDELQALEQWSFQYSVSLWVTQGTWTCTIREHSYGTDSGYTKWEDRQVVGRADHDPVLAMQSALIQAKAKWPNVKL